MSDTKDSSYFIPTLPQHCGHYNTAHSQFCSTCGQALPQDLSPYYKHWFYGFLYQKLRPLFDQGTSIYELLYTLCYPNWVDCSFDIKKETGIDIEIGQFVQGDDEGNYHPSLRVSVNGNDYEGDYFRGALPGYVEPSFGGIQPDDFFTLLCLETREDQDFQVYYRFNWNHDVLTDLDTNRPTDFDTFALAFMSHLDQSINFNCTMGWE